MVYPGLDDLNQFHYMDSAASCLSCVAMVCDGVSGPRWCDGVSGGPLSKSGNPRCRPSSGGRSWENRDWARAGPGPGIHEEVDRLELESQLLSAR